jgi:hypothetical protein
LWRIVMVRIAHDPETQLYFERRVKEGKTTCQRPLGIPHWRPLEFPRDGHENSPRTAMEFPACSAGEGHHPLA